MKANWSVNWKNGMKMSSEHFQKERLHHYFMQSLVSNIQLNDYNFGIVNHAGQAGLQYKLYNNKMSLEQCYGVSRSGWLFYVEAENNKNLESLNLLKLREEFNSGDIIQVYLKAVPQESNEFGDIDAETFPVRLPDSSQKYELEYMHLNNALETHNLKWHLPIAQLAVDQAGIDINKDYIPPVVKIESNKRLVDFHQACNNFNFELAKLNSLISQKLIGDSHTSYLKSNVMDLSSRLSTFIADQLDYFNYKLKSESPVDIFLFYKKINRLISAALANMQNRQEMVKLMADWSSSTPNDLIGSLNEIDALDYDHLDIQHSIKKIEEYTQLLSVLFNRLSAVNL